MKPRNGREPNNNAELYWVAFRSEPLVGRGVVRVSAEASCEAKRGYSSIDGTKRGGYRCMTSNSFALFVRQEGVPRLSSATWEEYVMDQTGQEGMPNWTSADLFQFGKKRTKALLTMQKELVDAFEQAGHSWLRG